MHGKLDTLACPMSMTHRLLHVDTRSLTLILLVHAGNAHTRSPLKLNAFLVHYHFDGQ